MLQQNHARKNKQPESIIWWKREILLVIHYIKHSCVVFFRLSAITLESTCLFLLVIVVLHKTFMIYGGDNHDIYFIFFMMKWLKFKQYNDKSMLGYIMT